MDNRLVIEIKNKSPIPLTDLTLSMLSISSQFSRFLDRNGVEFDRNKSPLYVRELRSGSSIIELAPYVIFALPLMQDFNTVCEFTKYLKNSYDFFLGRIDKSPIEYEKKDLRELSDCVNVTANDPGSQINFIAHSGAKQEINYIVSHTDANASQNVIHKQIESMKEPEKLKYEKQLLRWHQTRFDEKSEYGDRAIIESITRRPVKVIFINEKTKNAMISDVEHGKPWQELAYVVDVEVQTIDGVPKLYTITDFYARDTFDPYEEETNP